MTKKSIGPKVSEKYFGQTLMNAQVADEPYDPSSKVQAKDGIWKTGRGSQGGGSKPTPQAQRMTTGSGSRGAKVSIGSSYPKHTQKLRG